MCELSTTSTYFYFVFGNCPCTLSSWYQCVNGNPGFSDDVSCCITRSSDNGTLLCSFMLDEVAIHKQLDFDVSLDKFVGYVDMCVDLEDKAGHPLAHEAVVYDCVTNGALEGAYCIFFNCRSSR